MACAWSSERPPALRTSMLIRLTSSSGRVTSSLISSRSVCVRGFQIAVSTGLHLWPGIRQPVTIRPRIVGIEHVLMSAGDPSASGDRRDDAGPATHRHLALDAADELGIDDRAPHKAVADLQDA